MRRSNRSKDDLIPSLLDRLKLKPNKLEAGQQEVTRTISKEGLRRSVIRDLEWLLNARPVVNFVPRSKETLNDNVEGNWVNDSVLAFGMPAFDGKTISTIDVQSLETTVRKLIIKFEPRIDSKSLRVNALFHQVVMNRYNQVSLEITGHLWAVPYPIEIRLRTNLDLETGQVFLKQ